MKSFRALSMAALSFSVVAAVASTAPAHAQATPANANDAFASAGTGNYNQGSQINTGSQTSNTAVAGTNAPTLQAATNGTVGPQGQDATYITGVNTAGTVRVNNLANLEALLNIIANGLEILGIAWGGPTMIMGFMHMAAGTQDAMKRVLFGAAGVTGGLATPGCINWLVASARDANLFS
ncbi:MAG: hypothetical protein P4L53_05580 [Candidatus Obscuribacterales bacterium]|nr:hypothetical protein [Candidatus Obscuribacterales bacterium]